MRAFGFFLSLVFLHSPLIAQEPRSALGDKTPNPPKLEPVVVHKIQYTGTLSEKKASFLVRLSLECTNKVETVLPLLTGDIAVTDSKLPEGLRLDRSGKGYLLLVSKPGEYEVELNILAKITKADPWRKVEFTGPAATIGGVNAEVAGNGMELELLSGIPQPRAEGEKSKVSGALGADHKVSLRWQTKVTQQERPSLLTVQTISTVQITPTIIKYSSVYNYDILQGKPTNVVLSLPASQTLTSVKSGAPVRDRRIETLNGQQVLTIDFVKPLEKKYSLTLLTEQPVVEATANLFPPEPQNIERERGQVNLLALDMKVEAGNLAGLRQVNAEENTIGAWQFFGRVPFQLEVGMQRIEPVLNANDVVRVVLEEKMLKIIHTLTLNIEKAGVYTVKLTPQAGLLVTDVVGTGISDWETKDGEIMLEFSARVMGQRQVTVVLEEMSDELPAQVKIAPLLVTGAQRQTAQIAVTPARGLELKTDDNGTDGLREAPASVGLAFSAANPNWNLALAPHKLPPRLIAQVSNGVVIGENRVYGFTKIFYAIIDQGVRQFHVRVPAEWENVQFLGTRKRRELKFVDNNASRTKDYTLTLQGEVWDQYTLQVTYDLPLGENLSLRGAHPMQAGADGLEKLERNTGTIVIHSAANVKLEEPETDLSRIDPSELDKHERSRITHPILYAFKYDGEPFNLKVTVGRYQELELLNSVADYAELTTVVTGIGQVATTALLSVKKTDKDNPSFKLPEGSEFISCRIDGTTVTPGLENDNYIIPLPEDASRNQVFEVQISYSEKHDRFKHEWMLAKILTGSLKLSGPVTLNIPNTYSRWTVYVPSSHELFGFEGNMVAPREKQYTLPTAWERFSDFLRRVNWAGPVLTSLIMIGLLAILIVYLSRGPRKALITTGAIVGVLILGGLAVTLSMDGIASVKYAGADAEYATPSSPAGSVYYERGEAKAEGEEESLLSGKGKPQMESSSAAAPSDDPASSTRDFKTKSPSGPDAAKEFPRRTPLLPGQPQLPSGIPRTSNGGLGGGGLGLGDPFGSLTKDGVIVVLSDGLSRSTRSSGRPDDSGRVTGVLPPEFNVPTDGRAYVFTKALNLAGKDEPLKIDASIMDWNFHRTRTGIFQWLIALAGVVVLVLEYRREKRASLRITAGLAMILGGVGDFMCSQGTLHLLFINALWVFGLAVYAWAAWFFWPVKRYSPPLPPLSDDKRNGGSGDE
jgi:hypothetical protein